MIGKRELLDIARTASLLPNIVDTLVDLHSCTTGFTFSQGQTEAGTGAMRRRAHARKPLT